MSKLLQSVLAVSFVLTSAALAKRWDGYNTPSKISADYVYDVNQLPLNGELPADKTPWPETYWPTFRGGIAYRWAKPVSTWKYHLNTEAEVRAMTPEQLALLSPAEKYDIYMGDFTYPTVKRERKRTSSGAAKWAGLCHGWTPAALLHPEPKAGVRQRANDPNAIAVPFGSSDVKGLLTYYYGKIDWDPSGWIGKRCKGGLFGFLNKGCNGVNAGTFHVVLTNQIGIMRRGFIADVDREREIWNQPVYSFVSTETGRSGNTRSYRTVMRYAQELKKSQWDDVLATTGPVFRDMTFEYSVDLVGSTIVGGTWKSTNRPGFLWQHELVDFADPYYGKIKDLL